MIDPYIFWTAAAVGYIVIARATSGYMRAQYPKASTLTRIAWSLAWPVGFFIEIGLPPRQDRT